MSTKLGSESEPGDDEIVTKPKGHSSPEQTGAAGKTRNTHEEPTPTERYQTNAESAISPLEETDIFSLSRDEKMEVLRSLSIWNDYVMDDAEPLKDLIGLGKPPLSEDDSILLLHTNDVVDTSPDKCHRHRAIGEMANPRNQLIEILQIQYTDKVADESVAVQRQISPRPRHLSISRMTDQVQTQTRTPKRIHCQTLLVRREEDDKYLQAAIFQSDDICLYAAIF